MKPASKSILIVSERGQVTLPAPVRNRLGIKEGGLVTLEERPGEVVIRPAVATEIEMYSDVDIARWDKEDRLEPEARRKIRRKLGR
jgi:antitoxin PrlF